MALKFFSYMQFLINSYKDVKETMDGADQLYSSMFAQIERVKAGKHDVNFIYNKKQKRYIYSVPIKNSIDVLLVTHDTI